VGKWRQPPRARDQDAGARYGGQHRQSDNQHRTGKHEARVQGLGPRKVGHARNERSQSANASIEGKQRRFRAIGDEQITQPPAQNEREHGACRHHQPLIAAKHEALDHDKRISRHQDGGEPEAQGRRHRVEKSQKQNVQAEKDVDHCTAAFPTGRLIRAYVDIPNVRRT
jgi:hypothetical protein